MTEAEWLGCDDQEKMLQFVRGKASERKLRLFACACCFQVWRLIRHPDSQQAVETSERYADGLATAAKLRAAGRKAMAAASELAFEATIMMRLAKWAARDAAQAAALTAEKRIDPVRVAAQVRAAVTATPDKPNDQRSLLGCVFGNPFRSIAIDPTILRWNNGTIPKLAQAIYDERAFDRLPVLADALEDAGCTSEELLSHCRAGGEHMRGCWAVDLLLGKE
jgi:hypothetical protein